jgi:hypothetical protein
MQSRPSATSGSRQSGRVHRADPVVVDPVLELVTVEADVAAHLDDRDAPLVGQSAHVALARAQTDRNFFESEEGGRRAMLSASGTPQRGPGGRTSAAAGLSVVRHR